MKIYALVNSAGELLCKNHSGKFFASKDKIDQALTYTHFKNAEYAGSTCGSRRMTQINGIKINDFRPEFIEVTWEIIKPDLNEDVLESTVNRLDNVE